PRIVAISDDVRIVVVADTEGVLRTFNVETATKLSEIPVAFPGGGGSGIEGLDISPDGKTLAVSGNGGVNLLDLGDRTVAPKFLASPGRTVRAVVFSPDGKLLAGGDDGPVSARLWNVKTGEFVKTFITAGEKHYYPSKMVFTSDSKRLIVP